MSAYYEADSKGQEWVRQVDAVLQEEMGHSDDSSSASDAVKARLGKIYHQDEGMVVTDIPMERGQSLRIELTLVCGEGMRYQIHSWYVYDSGQYEIDNSMPGVGREFRRLIRFGRFHRASWSRARLI